MSKVQAGTTIDNLNIEAHRRYAHDQAQLDPRFSTTESNAITSHAELAGTSAIYASQLEQLIQPFFGTIPWASFQAPYGFFTQTNRFFRSRLFPQTKKTLQQLQLMQEENGEENEQEEADEPEFPMVSMLQKNYSARKEHTPSTPQEERDINTLSSFLEKIGQIDALLAHITARKLQYQKG